MIQAAKRKSSGCHTFEGFSSMIYIVAAKLSLAFHAAKRVSFDECEILILSIKKDNTESISAFYAAFDNAHQVLFDCCFQITALCGVRIAADLFLAVGIIYVYVVSFLGFGIPYIFHETTGHKRLGFGIARVILALLHFNIFVFIYRA